MSGVRGQVSGVRYNMSGVRRQVAQVFLSGKIRLVWHPIDFLLGWPKGTPKVEVYFRPCIPSEVIIQTEKSKRTPHKSKST